MSSHVNNASFRSARLTVKKKRPRGTKLLRYAVMTRSYHETSAMGFARLNLSYGLVYRDYHALIVSRSGLLARIAGDAMRPLVWIAAVCVACALAGCFDVAAKLSQEEEKLLDAVTYLFTGLEDNLDETGGKGMRWQRTVKGRSIEYWRISENGIGFSSDELNKKTRGSKYVRYVYRLTSPEPCAFTFANATEFSKADSQEDFSAFSSGNLLEGKTFNIGSARTFQFEDDGFRGYYLRIVGPRIMCDGPNYCENAWNDVFSNLSLGRFRDDEHWERRKKALALIKRACPGKEF